MNNSIALRFLLVLGLGWLFTGVATAAENSLVGHWKLQGDCRDYSGHENHGVNHGVELNTGAFDGVSSYIEVPAGDSLKLGKADFALCAWIYTEEQLDDIVGDVVELYDPARRRGMTLSINSSAGGYQSQGTDRHVHFGIDNGQTSEFEDCGRPNPTSNYVSNSLTVFKGKLYSATTDAQDEKNWCHVYRYDGGQRWTDCGRVGDGRTTGVMPLIVHAGELYAATSTYDWTRVREGSYDAGRVYRFEGGAEWKDCGQPSDNRTLNSMASFQGKLYAGGGPNSQGVFVRGEDEQWRPSKLFPKEGPERCFPHTMCRHNGRLYTAWPGVHAFDGQRWTYVGDPLYSEQNPMLQTHSMTIYQGELHVGTWPEAKVAVFRGNDTWQDIGRVGKDGTEVNALVVYNGKLYGGSIPRAEVCRLDGASGWTSLKQFYSPEGWRPGVPGKASREEVKEWSRVTSLTVYGGKLFASTGSCTSSVQDAPADVRGKVFSMEAGRVASYDDDLGPGWKHLAAVRQGDRLTLYVDGKLVAESSAFNPADYDLSIDQPLRIGFGQTEYFSGRMADVRLYRGALKDGQIQELSSHKPE
jgi:hypothetical protein